MRCAHHSVLMELGHMFFVSVCSAGGGCGGGCFELLQIYSIQLKSRVDGQWRILVCWHDGMGGHDHV